MSADQGTTQSESGATVKAFAFDLRHARFIDSQSG
jgi:hypothetical protein